MASSTGREGSNDERKIARDEMMRPVGDVLAALARRWGREREYRLWQLREQWSAAIAAPWANEIRPLRIDDDDRLVVAVPRSASLRMEIQRKGERWRHLLDGCRQASGYDLTDLVVESAARRSDQAKKGKRTDERRYPNDGTGRV